MRPAPAYNLAFDYYSEDELQELVRNGTSLNIPKEFLIFISDWRNFASKNGPAVQYRGRYLTDDEEHYLKLYESARRFPQLYQSLLSQNTFGNLISNSWGSLSTFTRSAVSSSVNAVTDQFKAARSAVKQYQSVREEAKQAQEALDKINAEIIQQQQVILDEVCVLEQTNRQKIEAELDEAVANLSSYDKTQQMLHEVVATEEPEQRNNIEQQFNDAHQELSAWGAKSHQAAVELKVINHALNELHRNIEPDARNLITEEYQAELNAIRAAEKQSFQPLLPSYSKLNQDNISLLSNRFIIAKKLAATDKNNHINQALQKLNSLLENTPTISEVKQHFAELTKIVCQERSMISSFFRGEYSTKTNSAQKLLDLCASNDRLLTLIGIDNNSDNKKQEIEQYMNKVLNGESEHNVTNVIF